MAAGRRSLVRAPDGVKGSSPMNEEIGHLALLFPNPIPAGGRYTLDARSFAPLAETPSTC